jgi:glycine betaine/choline ABC-type transport system substrate-binding protein
LTGKISAEDMRHLNYAVDGQKQDPVQVVEQYLREHKISPS